MYAYRSRYCKTIKCSNCESNIDNNDAICNTCGMEFLDTDAICIEDSYKQYYSYPFSQKSRKHNPNKYCKNWLLQLQGKESINISSEDFNKILNLAKKWLDQNDNLELCCTIIRNWLRCLSLTKYYTHITWLRKEIESACEIKGHSYELTDCEISEIVTYFSEITKQFSSIKDDPEIIHTFKRKNMLYYPFVIAKVLHLVIHDKNRLNILLSNVHFQDKKTLAKNEYVWEVLRKKLNY